MSRWAPTVGCKVDGCDRPHRSKGLCRTHYMRWHRTGTPHLDGRTTAARTTAAPPPPARTARSNGRIQDAVPVIPDGGTVTLEAWKRLRAAPAADVHIVRTTNGVSGDAA